MEMVSLNQKGCVLCVSESVVRGVANLSGEGSEFHKGFSEDGVVTTLAPSAIGIGVQQHHQKVTLIMTECIHHFSSFISIFKPIPTLIVLFIHAPFFFPSSKLNPFLTSLN